MSAPDYIGMYINSWTNGERTMGSGADKKNILNVYHSSDPRSQGETDDSFSQCVTANDTQVGGNHYKRMKIQHWDFAISNNMGYMEGQITKYISRWRDKNGLQDLEKAQHFLEKLIESVKQGDRVGLCAEKTGKCDCTGEAKAFLASTI